MGYNNTKFDNYLLLDAMHKYKHYVDDVIYQDSQIA